MNVQHLSLGPVEIEKRRFRLQFWPDKHNTGGKQIGRLLATQSTDALPMDAFHCIAPGSLDTSLSHAAGLSDIAVCHA